MQIDKVGLYRAIQGPRLMEIPLSPHLTCQFSMAEEAKDSVFYSGSAWEKYISLLLTFYGQQRATWPCLEARG